MRRKVAGEERAGVVSCITWRFRGTFGGRLLEHLCIIYSTATSDHVVGGTGESHLV